MITLFMIWTALQDTNIYIPLHVGVIADLVFAMVFIVVYIPRLMNMANDFVIRMEKRRSASR